MTPPIIGITVSRNHKNQRSYNLNPSDYSEAIVLAGGLPILLPVEFPLPQINSILSHLDGLLISGGGDIDNHLYGGEAHHTISGICEARDKLEMELLQAAILMKKPVLGICRGMQLINVALGGTLYTDIPEQFKTTLIHNSPEENGRDNLVHEVELELNSNLGRIIGQEQFRVNSFHHQAIKSLSPDLMVTAHATDGLIEAVEMVDKPFGVIGVQWHPECLITIPSQLALFRSFIAASQR
ncbi:gamma-glutamyl-gamma-aminobutyrate hydrolase family protein [bacterium]|nr:gamma-glutamyl-gamma-aminobutyrate hydrolase family protein [bacterium]